MNQSKGLTDYREDLAAALMFLSRIPIPWQRISQGEPIIERSYWAFPVVGLLLGLLLGLCAALLFFLGIDDLLVCAVLVLLLAVLTGGLHEDGLADMVDGFWGAFNKARRIEIMRDSRIGSYGVLALIFSVFIRILALFTLSAHGGTALIAGLICALVGSRLAIVLLYYIAPNASEQGLAATIAKPSQSQAQAAALLTLVVLLILAPFSIAFVSSLVIVGAVAFMAFLSKRYIGGVTGDVLGACEQLTQCLLLIALSSYW